MVGYYDKILAAIAGSLLGGVALGLVTQVALSTGILFGALIATFFVYDAMFRNPPIPHRNPSGAVAVVIWHGFLGIAFAAALFP